MTHLSYKDGKKLQVEFTEERFVEDTGVFLLHKFLEKQDFETLAKNHVPVLGEFKGQKKFSAYDKFLQEIYMSLTDNRSITNIQYLKENKMYDFLFDEGLAEKSTINNFQNSFGIKESFAFSQLSTELVKNNPEFLFSHNGMIILDSDAVDIETHGKQQGSFGHGYYRQTMYYPDVITVYDGRLPITGRLRAGNCHGGNGDLELLHETLTSLDMLDCFKWSKVLLRGDSAFGNEKKFLYAENHQAKYLIRIASNSRLKDICEQCDISITQNKDDIFVISYKANSWSKERFVVVNIVQDYESLFPKVQFFCTNLWTEKDQKKTQKQQKHKLKRIIELYHKRGVSEHPFHDLKESFQAGKTSSHNFWANSYRFQVSLIALQIYVLFREIYLHNTSLKRAYYKTIFTSLFSLTGKIVHHARKVILKIPEYSKKARLFFQILRVLQT